MVHRKTLSFLLPLLWGSLLASGKLSPKVIALQEVLYSELITLDRSVVVTHPLHDTPDESVLHRLRTVFHEFERQNQECVTAMLRVLALVDHTLENTIQDCEKVFHLPSLDSGNVLFRDVTRPLLLHIETLCQQIAAGDLDELEATMEAVEREAYSYRQRFEETKRHMQIVLDAVDKHVNTFSIATKVDELFDEMERLNETISDSVVAVTGKLLARQKSICDAVLEVRATNEDEEMLESITNFIMFLEHQTERLVEDLTEDLHEWFNETSLMINIVNAEIENIPRDLMESPMEGFLQNATSLKCLAECSKQMSMDKLKQELDRVLQCFAITNDTERPFAMAYQHLNQTADDVHLAMQDILHCQQSTVRDGYDFSDVANCFEMANPIVEAMENYVDTRMDEIFLHVDLSLYYNELKMESCVYYRAREIMITVSRFNHHYQQCNVGKDIEL